MASTASTLSWSSSSLLQSFTGNINQATKVADRATSFVVIAQKKAKKARTVMGSISLLGVSFLHLFFINGKTSSQFEAVAFHILNCIYMFIVVVVGGR